ncbi:SEL1-like repeat protein [Maritimibacter dapengensis]|uniref:SEL1-like repeat protein n=1 Tax=Maritimibacter dapengensis TaxID=2836868 RepID=A0ABS6T1T7_9RHOB|nr:SEL1-like repeat protein [Maritimibacter dapengensis]MBV7378945.1 SEL1-like repeat protein [Maritimibacter dapengensis]
MVIDWRCLVAVGLLAPTGGFAESRDATKPFDLAEVVPVESLPETAPVVSEPAAESVRPNAPTLDGAERAATDAQARPAPQVEPLGGRDPSPEKSFADRSQLPDTPDVAETEAEAPDETASGSPTEDIAETPTAAEDNTLVEEPPAPVAAPNDANGDVDDTNDTEMAEDPSNEQTEPTDAPEPGEIEEAAGVVDDTDTEPAPAAETIVAAPEPEPDPFAEATAQCLEIAGPADAGVPAAALDAETQRDTLRRAAPFCRDAVNAPEPNAEVLFHAAAIAQAMRNKDETLDYLTRAADLGLGAAETRLGDYHLFGVGGRPDVAQAVSHYQKAAELGDPAGTTTLALLHQVGQGVPRDPTRMVELMTEAADAGYHFAQYRLAQVYLRGDGVPGGDTMGQGAPDPIKAVRYYTLAAEAGNLAAALELSELYADPASGVPENPAEQVRLTRMVSRTGHAPAIARMGVFYELGYGVDYLPEVAAGLYARALETGEVSFQMMRAGAPAQWDRDTALAFQRVLQDRGLYNGPLDAIVGAGTAAAAARLATE